MNEMQRLLNIMRDLRDPETGCPWDKEQTFESIAPYTIEEAYEVVDAIESKNYSELKSELGDLLLQVVYHSEIANEKSLFDFESVVKAIGDKMVSRHPHVFSDEQEGKAVSEVKSNWEALKAEERVAKQQLGTMDDIPKNLPALSRAHKIQKRASNAGFDWTEIQGVVDKIKEELSEVEEALVQGKQEAIEEELGDLLFSCVNLTRHAEVNAEKCLRAANQKFIKRFSLVEEYAKNKNEKLTDCSTEKLEAYWQQAKQN